MRILVTGGAGFLGARVVRAAALAGHSVTAIGRADQAARLSDLGGDIHYVRGDISKVGVLQDEAARVRPDVIIHCAALGVSRNDGVAREALLTASVAMAREVAASADGSGAAVAWIGSCFEYAPSTSAITEDHRVAPQCSYGTAKLAGYREFVRRSRRARSALLVPFHLYGVGEDSARFVPTALLAPLGLAPNNFGDPEIVRDFVWVDDAAAAIMAAADALVAGRVASGEAFNVCTGIGTSLSDMAALAARAVGKPSFRYTFVGSPPIAGYDPSQLVGSPVKTATILGWRATTTPRVGLAHLAALARTSTGVCQ